MKLRYWDARPNFGDELNVWLWPRVLPGLLDDDESHIFLGIGTLIGLKAIGKAKNAYKHVFGSGYGIGQVPEIDDRWVFHFVRGPKTAQVCGLHPSKGITDPALLVNGLARPAPKKYRVSFMPHHVHDESYDFRQVCAQLGMHYISPVTRDVDHVLDEIAASELIVAEAMHGAIVADALRVPWVPIRFQQINSFKWSDWCSSVGLEYVPMEWSKSYLLPAMRRARLDRLAVVNDFFVRSLLEEVVRNPQCYLSRDSVVSDLHGRLWEQVRQFTAQYGAGRQV